MSTKKENPTIESLPEICSSPTSDVVDPDVNITLISPKMQRFVHLYMTGQYSLNKLGQLLEINPQTLSKWLKRADVKEIITDMQLDTHEMVAIQLKTLTLTATDKLGKLVNSPIDGVALQAVKDILDRAGHKAKQEIKIDKTITTFEQRLSNLINDTIIIDGEVVE